MAKPLRTGIRRPPTGGVSFEGDEERAQLVQGQYDQADQILREFAGAFSRGERKKVAAWVQIKDKDTGVVSQKQINLDQGINDAGLRLEDDIISIEVDAAQGASPELQDKVQQFNTMASTGGTTFGALASMDEGQRGKLAQAMMPRGPEQGRLDALFSRFRGGSAVLEATGQPKLAALARFAGEMGPEAEKVLDPHVRQAAYRYRGTEKEPDLALMREMNSQGMQKKIDALRVDEARAAVNRIVDQIEEKLKEQSDDASTFANSESRNH